MERFVEISDEEINRIVKSILNNKHVEKANFDKYSLYYCTSNSFLELGVTPVDRKNIQKGYESINMRLVHNDFNINLSKEKIKEMFGKSKYNKFKSDIEDYIVTINIKKEEDKIVFKNNFYNNEVKVSESFIKNSIIEIIKGDKKVAQTKEFQGNLSKQPDNFEIRMVEYYSGHNCYMCCEQKTRNIISLVHRWSPVIICPDCYERFLLEKTSAVNDLDIVSSLI